MASLAVQPVVYLVAWILLHVKHPIKSGVYLPLICDWIYA